jgi:hypothetical protein
MVQVIKIIRTKFFAETPETGSVAYTAGYSHVVFFMCGMYRARIFKRLWSPGIDSKAPIPPAYVAWRAGTITLFLLGA